MNPLSPIYYIKNNKGRACLIIFMLFFTTLMLVAGNYVASCDWYWVQSGEAAEKIALLEYIPSDTDQKDYFAVLEEMKADPKLHTMERTGYGYGGLSWDTTIGIEMGSQNMVFNTKEDMEAAFRRMGLTADLSGVKDGSVVIGKSLARNRGLQLGDSIDGTVERSLQEAHSLDALIEEDIYTTFYLIHDDTNLVRFYVFSDEMEGDQLYGYLAEKIGDRKVKVAQRVKENVAANLMPLHLVMIVGAVLLSVILAVTVNSVVNGQYQKRTYEFGVYRALGISRKSIFRKCAAEILLMDAAAVAVGSVVCFLTTFLLNELLYLPHGKYLPYLSGLGLICFAVSNLMVIIPMIISKGRRMSRTDVTEF